MRLVVLQAVEILIPFTTDLTFIWLFLLHSKRSRVWRQGRGIYDGKGSVDVFVKLLVVVTMLDSD